MINARLNQMNENLSYRVMLYGVSIYDCVVFIWIYSYVLLRTHHQGHIFKLLSGQLYLNHPKSFSFCGQEQ